jgi:hypothetical protein
MIWTILAAALPAPSSMPAPAVASLTAESLTAPRVDIQCKVLGRDQLIRTVEFQLTGARGYPTGAIPSFAATKPTFKVVKDETGVFSPAVELYDNTAFESFSGNWGGKLGRFDKNGRIYSAVSFFRNWDKSAAIVFEIQTPPMMSGAPNFAFTGICRTFETQQSPLSAAPAKTKGGK